MSTAKRTHVITCAPWAALILAVALLSGIQPNSASRLMANEADGVQNTLVVSGSNPPGGGPPFTLDIAALSYGGDNIGGGSILVVGRNMVGTMSNEDYTFNIGPVPAFVAATTGDGDGDDDGDVDLFDFEGFLACVTGPDASYTDPSCWSFDMNRDGRVDRTDFALFQLAFTGE
ncbi:MAG: hypothetical protein IID39_01590 [Planctomycetes bacterium]|nr:hypothetical protein [Planctomycetota bacterium]